MRINHNIASLNTYRQLSANSTNGSKSLEKLSSGLRINRAGDDAAGLAISEKMRGQIRGLEQASRNAQDGISLIQTAEGALNETHSILQRMRELAVQAANDTNNDNDRGEIQKEIEQLKSEINRISTDTEFNTKKLLNGDMGKTFQQSGGTAQLDGLQVTGINVGSGSFTIAITDAGTNTFSVTSGANAITGATNTMGAATTDIQLTAGARISYGSYTLNVTNINAGTADFELVGPNGETTVITGQGVNADLEIGGITFDFSAKNVTQNGTLKFDLTIADLDLTLSGDGSATITDLDYAGEQINLGGFEFRLKTGFGTTGTNVTGTVIDKAVKFHIGANADQNTDLAINNMSASALGVDSIDVSNQTAANAAITTIQSAIDKVSSERSKLGAIQNRLEHTINNLGTSAENLTASESRIRDVDMAKEMMEFTKNNILSQAAQAMLAQANTQPQGVLQLLR